MQDKAPRKLKKKRQKGLIIAFDIAATPRNMKISQIIDLYKKKNILMYNGSLGQKPTFQNLSGKQKNKFRKLKFIDVSEKTNPHN